MWWLKLNPRKSKRKLKKMRTTKFCKFEEEGGPICNMHQGYLQGNSCTGWPKKGKHE